MEPEKKLGQKTATSPIQDARSSPNLGDEGGAGLEQVPNVKPTARQKVKSGAWLVAGAVVALLFMLPMTRFEPQMYIFAIIIALVAIPIGAGAHKSKPKA